MFFPFAQLPHSLTEFLNLTAQRLDVIVRATFLASLFAPVFLAPWLLTPTLLTPTLLPFWLLTPGSPAFWLLAVCLFTTRLVRAVKRGAKPVRELIKMFGGFRQSRFPQMGDGLLDVLQLVLNVSAGRTIGFPDITFATAFTPSAFMHFSGLSHLAGLTAPVICGVLLACLFGFRGFLHGSLYLPFNILRRLRFPLVALAFRRFLLLLAGRIGFVLGGDRKHEARRERKKSGEQYGFHGVMFGCGEKLTAAAGGVHSLITEGFRRDGRPRCFAAANGTAAVLPRPRPFRMRRDFLHLRMVFDKRPVHAVTAWLPRTYSAQNHSLA